MELFSDITRLSFTIVACWKNSGSWCTIRFGCNKCLRIAIGSHRSELLPILHNRHDVVYRGMFWGLQPHSSRRNKHIGLDDRFPVLHCIDRHDDISQVKSWQQLLHRVYDEDFGSHISTAPSELSCRSQWSHVGTLTLNSTPSKCCAIRGKFDYSKPQPFHLFMGYPDIRKDLLMKKTPIFCCAFEARRANNFVHQPHSEHDKPTSRLRVPLIWS